MLNQHLPSTPSRTVRSYALAKVSELFPVFGLLHGVGQLDRRRHQPLLHVQGHTPVENRVQPIRGELDEIQIEFLLKRQRQLGKTPGGPIPVGKVPPETKGQAVGFLAGESFLDSLSMAHGSSWRGAKGERPVEGQGCGTHGTDLEKLPAAQLVDSRLHRHLPIEQVPLD
jgi:hypothetical protein